MIALAKVTRIPENGKDGIDGATGADGTNGLDGLRGADGMHGTKGLDGSKGEMGAVGPQGDKGEAGMVWRGTYRSDLEYWIGDVVGVSGSAYVCVAATNQAPPVGFGWELLVSRGAQGVRGIKGEDGGGGPAAAGTLTGIGLAGNVVESSLTKTGVLTNLTVTNAISGSITGNANTAGTVTTAAQPTITSVGTLTALTVNGTLTLGTTALISSTSATALAIQSAVPAGTGVTPTIQIICPSAAFTLLDNAAAQAVFPTPQDTIALQAATTYMVQGQYILQTGIVTHTTSISFASSGAITNPVFVFTSLASAHSSANAAANTQQSCFFSNIAGGIVANTSVLPNTIISFTGIIRTTDAGSLVPKITFSAAPGGTNYTTIGSYLLFYPLGANTIDSVGTALS